MKKQWRMPAILLGLLLWLAFCWSMLAGKEVPGFRDSAYLYFPFFEWLDGQWKSGTPLWNPYCNLGMSNAGDNTPSLFYPGKLIFSIGIFDFPTRYGIYVSLHILLAGIGAFCLARSLRGNPVGSMLAAISYAFGGSVLTQATNVIFLVSAAWLPFGLIAVWRLNRTGSIRYGCLAGICCAMMMLGGDPQMVYHLGLIAAASVVSRKLRNLRIGNGRLSGKRMEWRPFFGLGVMVATAVLLSVVQIWPTWQWSRLSERAAEGESLNIFQALQNTIREKSNPGNSQGLAELKEIARRTEPPTVSHWRTLWETPKPGTIAHHGYQFSLHPRSLVELLVPNAFGKMFPQHQRWGDGIQGADRIWYPSIYMGWLVAWLGLRGLRWSGSGPRVWLSRVFLFFLLGSFGCYGLFWLIPVDGVGGQVGGVYWWMTTFLPDYFSFRYPAKLFLIASLALSVLAGLRLRPAQLHRLDPGKSLMGVGLGILLTICFVGVMFDKFDLFFQGIAADPLFGPFDVMGVKRSLMFSIGQTLLMIVSVILLVRLGGKKSAPLANPMPEVQRRILMNSAFPNWAAFGLVAITAADLLAANHWILALVPKQVFASSEAKSEDQFWNGHPNGRGENTSNALGPLTIYRPRDLHSPSRWKTESSEHRLEEIVQWQKDSYYPKHHLGRHHVGMPIRLVGSFNSIWPARYEFMLQALEAEEKSDPLHGNELKIQKQDLCDGEVVVQEVDGEEQYRIELWRTRPSLVYLEDASATNGKAWSSDSKPKCEVIKFGTNAIEVEVAAAQQSNLIFKTLDDGNWEAEIRDRRDGTQSLKKMERSISGYPSIGLAQGDYAIRLVYNPRSFWWAASTSGIAWGLITIWLLMEKLVFRQGLPIKLTNDTNIPDAE